MPDTIVAASAAGAAITVAAAITTELVAEIRDRHDLWPTATAAVGRLTTGAALFAATNLKGNERVSLQIAGNGPLGTVAADSWLLDEQTIGARGYARNTRVDLPIDARGKFNVAAAIGEGSLHVTRSSDAGQPYAGIVPLVSGEIAEDLAHYLGQSEQTPSVVALGVLANPSGIVAAWGHSGASAAGCRRRSAVRTRAARADDATRDATHCQRRRCRRTLARINRRGRSSLVPLHRCPLCLPLQSREGGIGSARLGSRRAPRASARARSH